MALDAHRILARCDALASHSEQAGGLTRVFLSPEQRAVDDLVLGWMREAGMDAHLDAIGNCVGRYEGSHADMPCLMLGSHLDTVRDAGRYDGMLGVVTAIECVAALGGRRMPFAIEVVGFGDEEGVRFGSTLLGSRAIAGTFDFALLDKAGGDGVTLRESMRAFGLDPSRIATAARRHGDVLAYVELHIEQGPVLEAEGLAVGVVAAINGGYRFMVDVGGTAGHAGTVPMTLRRDALVAAAECIVAVEAIAREIPDVVGTVGRIEAHPGAMNVIPGRVRFSLDVRAPTDERRADALAAMRLRFERIAEARGVALSLEPVWEARTATCDARLQAQLAEAVRAQGVRVRHLPSGAGHDGMALIDLAPIGMLFVRCKGGISHNPAESVDVQDVAVGARALMRFIENFRPLA
ncbi:MAG TPA: allantoate amidohydrolase [Casimicrobiaceae bacterium]